MRGITSPAPRMRSPGRHLPAIAWLTLGVAGIILGPAALAGGWLLASSPDGSAMQMPLHWLEHTPFPDYLIPGLILLGVFGIGSYIVVVAGLLRLEATPYLAFALGAGQLIWIGVQLAMIRTWHPVMHPLLIAVGAALIGGSALWWRTWHRSH
jgi:hypothetical protein